MHSFPGTHVSLRVGLVHLVERKTADHMILEGGWLVTREARPRRLLGVDGYGPGGGHGGTHRIEPHARRELAHGEDVARVVGHSPPLPLHHAVAPRLVGGAGRDADALSLPLALDVGARQLARVVSVHATDSDPVRVGPRMKLAHGEIGLALSGEQVNLIHAGIRVMEAYHILVATVNVPDPHFKNVK